MSKDLAGFIGVTLIDYPAKVASVIFTYGCNFRCPFCQNPELVIQSQHQFFSVDYIFKKISERSKFITGVCITGGEPTLYPFLFDLIEKIKGIGLSVKLDTNGSNPRILKRLLSENLLDYTAMDIKSPISEYDIAVGSNIDKRLILSSIELLMNSGTGYEFRTTCYPPVIDGEGRAFEQIGALVKGAELFALQQFRATKTIDSAARNVAPYTVAKLQHFSDILRKYVGKVEIRGV